MTAGMVGFGALLAVRHLLGRREPPLAVPTPQQAHGAARAIFVICALTALFVLGVVVLRLRDGGGIAALSVIMPAVTLLWLASLGVKSLRSTASPEPASAPSERSRRRTSSWEPGRAATKRSQGSGRQVSA